MKTPTVTTVKPAAPAAAKAHSALQRKCECRPGSAQSCEKCSDEGTLQRKAAYKAPPDDGRYEAEADRVAEQVLAMPTAGVVPTQRMPAPTIQRRRIDHDNAVEGEVPAEVTNALGAAGRGLDSTTRRYFEPRFGLDLSRVRVHVDDAATRSIDAHAFTVGHRIVFGTNQYQPTTDAGRRLIAHELTHVVQQGAAAGSFGGALSRQAASVLQRKPKPEAPPPYKGKILDIKDIKAKDPAAYKLLHDTQGQAQCKVCHDVNMTGCNTVLEPGTEVTVTGSEVGGRWLTIKNTGFKGIDEKRDGHILAGFVEAEDVPPPKKIKLPSVFTDAPAQGDLSSVLKLQPDKPVVPEVQFDPNKILKEGQVPRRAVKEEDALAEQYFKMEKPGTFVYHIEGDEKDAFAWITKQRQELPFIFGPGAQIDIAPKLDLIPGPKVIITVVPDAQAMEKYQATKAAVGDRDKLGYMKMYFTPEVVKSRMAELKTPDQAVRAKKIAEKLWSVKDKLDDFNKRYAGQITDWDTLEMRVNEFVERQRQIKKLMKATPESAKGSELEEMHSANAGVEAETPEITAQQEKLEAELQRRQGIVTSLKGVADQEAKEFRESPEFLLNPVQAEENLLGKTFTLGFIAGAQLELPPDSWDKLKDKIGKNKGVFGGGILAGIIPGAVGGVVDAVVGIVELAAMATEFALGPYIDIAKMVHDKPAFEKEQKEKKERVKAIAGAALDMAKNLLKDPAFLAPHAFNFGVGAGRQAADWFKDEFVDESVFSEGYDIGKLIGRIIIEIVMLVVAPEEMGAKALSSGRKATAATRTAVEALMEAFPALRALRKAKPAAEGLNLADKAGEGSKIARGLGEVGAESKKLVQGEEAAGKATKLAEEAKGGGQVSKLAEEAQGAKQLKPPPEGDKAKIQRALKQDKPLSKVKDPKYADKYELEMTLEDGVVYRKEKGRNSWCRFNSPEDCNIDLAEQLYVYKRAMGEFSSVRGDIIEQELIKKKSWESPPEMNFEGIDAWSGGRTRTPRGGKGPKVVENAHVRQIKSMTPSEEAITQQFNSGTKGLARTEWGKPGQEYLVRNPSDKTLIMVIDADVTELPYQTQKKIAELKKTLTGGPDVNVEWYYMRGHEYVRF